MAISALGYLGFEVSDPAAWADYMTAFLGAAPAAPAVDGAARFRVDAHDWRFELREGPKDDIVFAGFEVADAARMLALADRLQAAGVTVGRDNAELARRRGVRGLITCQDPHGLDIEIYFGPTLRGDRPFVSPAGVSGFLTGDQGVGHIVLSAPEMGACRRFYVDLLGFVLSDYITLQLGPEFAIDLEFFHCNGRHHTLALAPIPAPKRLNHFMLQARALDDVGFALDRAMSEGLLSQSLGRHTNDAMVSFYARTPSGFEVEFGFGGLDVDDSNWRVSRHDRTSIWGHKRLASGKN